jgi:hypothetical protein
VAEHEEVAALEPLLPPAFWESFYMVMREMQGRCESGKLRASLEAARASRRESA